MISSEPTKVLPHRDPFLWVHRLLSCNENCSEGIVEYDVSSTLELFKGHFPAFPVFPGVLQVEAAAQACGWVYMNKRNPTLPPAEVLFVSVETFKFKRPVKPDCTLVFKVLQKVKKRGLHLWDVSVEDKQTQEIYSFGTIWLMMKE